MFLEKWDSRKASYQVLLTIDTAVKLNSVGPWVHISQLKKCPPDTWSCVKAQFSSVQWLSRVWLFASLPVHHQLPEFT